MIVRCCQFEVIDLIQYYCRNSDGRRRASAVFQELFQV